MKWLAYLLFGVLAYSALVWQVVTLAAATQSQPAWASPSVMTIKRVSPLESAQSAPNYMSNLDCNLVTYRLAATTTIQSGCFTETAFGQIDTDSDLVIFNGTDEAMPLLGYSSRQSLVPWPRAGSLVSLSPATTGESYISLYKNPLLSLQDKRNILLQLTGKQLTAPPDLQINDKLGQPLRINSQTMAFSDGGSWLVAETFSGSFVRINLASLDIKAFAPAFGATGSPGALMSHVAISSDGRYVAISNQAAPSFKIYDLTRCSGNQTNLQPEDCPSYDYRPFANQQIAGLQSIKHVRFVNDGLLSFEARSSNPANGGIYVLAPTEGIESLIDYLGLGDSYTSGEGAYNYIAATDSPDNMCHLSVHSYPLLLTRDLFSSRGGHSVACSGAAIKDVGSTSDSYRGQVRNVLDFKHLKEDNPALLNAVMTNFVPGYVAQHRFVKQYQPRVVTVSVGGNDVGFGDILEQCVMPHISRHTSDSTCFNTYEGRVEVMNLVDRTVPRWTALYKQLQAEAPGSRLYAIGYPRVVSDTGSCPLNVQLGKSELEFAEELVVYINAAVQKSAKQAGVVYVDISEALFGHRLCETASHNVAVNGLTAGKDSGFLGLKVFGKESYHPNALGHRLIEQTIFKKTGNLTLALPATDPITSSGKLLNAPKSGRKITNRLPDSGMTSKVAKAGKTAKVYVDGNKHGLKPKTTYKIRLDGLLGLEIGTVTSDENGTITTEVTIPGGTAPGGHTIDVTGENQAGEETNVTQPIYVPAGDTDSDGDGLVDTDDSCPAAINSGQDADQDGTDDTCDGFIGLPPSSNAQDIGLVVTAASTNPNPPTPGRGPTRPLQAVSSPTPKTTLKTSPPVPLASISQVSTLPTKSHNINWLPWILIGLFTWLFLVLVGIWIDQRLSHRQERNFRIQWS